MRGGYTRASDHDEPQAEERLGLRKPDQVLIGPKRARDLVLM